MVGSRRTKGPQHLLVETHLTSSFLISYARFLLSIVSFFSTSFIKVIQLAFQSSRSPCTPPFSPSLSFSRLSSEPSSPRSFPTTSERCCVAATLSQNVKATIPPPIHVVLEPPVRKRAAQGKSSALPTSAAESVSTLRYRNAVLMGLAVSSIVSTVQKAYILITWIDSCDSGYFCSSDGAKNTYCCPDGMELGACAQAYSLTVSLVSQTGSIAIPSETAVASDSAPVAIPTSETLVYITSITPPSSSLVEEASLPTTTVSTVSTGNGTYTTGTPPVEFPGIATKTELAGIVVFAGFAIFVGVLMT
jgi:hypothetical protein